MTMKFKSRAHALEFALSLKARRTALGKTLKEAEIATGVDAGQLSRFERGDFKFASKNLQKYSSFLHIPTQDTSALEGLGQRVEDFAARSPRHKRAIQELLQALEDLA